MIFDVIAGRSAGIVAGVGTASAWMVLWVALPLLARRGTTPDVLR
jgi:hypothetical protein